MIYTRINMLRKIFFLLFSISLLTTDEMKCCTCNPKIYELSTTGKVVVYGLVGTGAVAGAVFAAPLVLSASTIVAIQAATAAAATAATSAASSVLFPVTVVGKVGLGLTAAQWVRPYVLQTTEEKLTELLKQRAEKPTKSKTEFVSCLIKNKADSPRNASGRPVVCEDAALFYAFNS